MLSPTLTGWYAQYELMKRSYARLSKTHASSIEYDDDLQHFFQDCWHLKDWIKNDTSVTKGLKDAIEGEVKAHKSLRIAADIAIGCKHLSRTTNREGAYVTSKSVIAHLGQARGVDVFHTITLDDGSTLSAQDVARDAFRAWDAVLRNCGLI
jgi:hypothetical protein